MNEYFEYWELPRIGTAVKTKVPYSGVEKGTIGRIVNYYKAGRNSTRDADFYAVEIRWNRFPGDTLVDGFSKSDYENGLEAA
jgi:hypothetical protein